MTNDDFVKMEKLTWGQMCRFYQKYSARNQCLYTGLIARGNAYRCKIDNMNAEIIALRNMEDNTAKALLEIDTGYTEASAVRQFFLAKWAELEVKKEAARKEVNVTAAEIAKLTQRLEKSQAKAKRRKRSVRSLKGRLESQMTKVDVGIETLEIDADVRMVVEATPTEDVSPAQTTKAVEDIPALVVNVASYSEDEPEELIVDERLLILVAAYTEEAVLGEAIEGKQTLGAIVAEYGDEAEKDISGLASPLRRSR